jgi:hypothetical protein
MAETPPYAGAQVWDNSFLPPDHQGVRTVPGEEPIPNLRAEAQPATLSELERIMLRDVNEIHANARPDDAELRARMSTFEIARGMMREAPEVLNLSQESAATLDLYGVKPGDKKSFGWQCLIARRLTERGVRVVELIDSGSNENWDAHSNIMEHVPKAQRVDQAIAALIQDLKRSGLLAETLIAICTEFGRTPWAEQVGGKGRGHWAKAFTSLLAGAGVQGGTAYGETDEIGETIAANPVHVHDYHATILHLMGIDHERLTYRYAGRDFRLTDVHGRVLREVLS